MNEQDQEKLIETLAKKNAELRKENEQLKAAAAAKKAEYSKKLADKSFILVVAVTVFSFCMTWRIRETSALIALISAVFAQWAAVTAFYYAKAKVENKIKLMAHYGVKPEASNFNDN